MKTIIDTSILISLAKINYLEIIPKLKSALLIPHEVYEESVVEGEKKDLPDATLIKRFIVDNKIAILKVKSSQVKAISLKIKKVLPRGDRAVLALALHEKAVEIMTDDEGLNKIALSLRFKVSASPDLLLQAFKKGAVNLQIFEKYIRSLVLENRLGSIVAEFYIMEGKKYVES